MKLCLLLEDSCSLPLKVTNQTLALSRLALNSTATESSPLLSKRRIRPRGLAGVMRQRQGGEVRIGRTGVTSGPAGCGNQSFSDLDRSRSLLSCNVDTSSWVATGKLEWRVNDESGKVPDYPHVVTMTVTRA